jgi:hypothetical protein
VLREALRRAGQREGLVEALGDTGQQWDVQLERNRLLEAVADAALSYRQATEGNQDTREAGRRLDAAQGSPEDGRAP